MSEIFQLGSKAALFDSLVLNLEAKGWARAGEWLPDSLYQDLLSDCRSLEAAGVFSKAHIGKQETIQRREDVRGDFIYWLDLARFTSAQRQFWLELSLLRQALAKKLFMPLHYMEFHYAIYPPGTFYKKHVDQFQGSDHRQISFVFFLNPGWQKTDGGLLRIFSEAAPDRIEAEIVPHIGDGIVFLSGSIPHEVTETMKKRYSITGWMRTRTRAIEP